MLKDGQYVFRQVIEQYLNQITRDWLTRTGALTDDPAAVWPEF